LEPHLLRPGERPLSATGAASKPTARAPQDSTLWHRNLVPHWCHPDCKKAKAAAEYAKASADKCQTRRRATRCHPTRRATPGWRRRASRKGPVSRKRYAICHTENGIFCTKKQRVAVLAIPLESGIREVRVSRSRGPVGEAVLPRVFGVAGRDARSAFPGLNQRFPRARRGPVPLGFGTRPLGGRSNDIP
jgi:hypothetical protein